MQPFPEQVCNLGMINAHIYHLKLSNIVTFPHFTGTPEASSIMRELAERSLIGTYLYS